MHETAATARKRDEPLETHTLVAIFVQKPGRKGLHETATNAKKTSRTDRDAHACSGTCDRKAMHETAATARKRGEPIDCDSFPAQLKPQQPLLQCQGAPPGHPVCLAAAAVAFFGLSSSFCLVSFFCRFGGESADPPARQRVSFAFVSLCVWRWGGCNWQQSRRRMLRPPTAFKSLRFPVVSIMISCELVVFCDHFKVISAAFFCHFGSPPPPPEPSNLCRNIAGPVAKSCHLLDLRLCARAYEWCFAVVLE